MKSVVVGTAGHIDHGKSALVQALTGTDPDRLKEEKARGITIDLGFANLQVGDINLAFVDVPGHERFVKNMLAGAGGIDIVVLVVAADESIMPQTREHFDICRLLRVTTGVVAVTKTDLVDSDTVGLVSLEIADLVAGSFLADAPVIPVSARTRAGLDDLLAALVRAATTVQPRSADHAARLPIDRVFSKRGFGTIVTGTLASGRVRTDDELLVAPGRRRVKVRGLQVHGIGRGEVVAGQRTALNLGGIEVEELHRGQSLVTPQAYEETRLADAVIEVLADARPLKHGRRVRIHHGTAEILARLAIIGPLPAGESDSATQMAPLAPGARGYVRLRLERPMVFARGDRFIIRSYSPPFTVGGGQVLDPVPPRNRIRSEGALERCRRLDSDLQAEGETATQLRAAEVFIEEAGDAAMPVAKLISRAGTSPRDVPACLEHLAAQGIAAQVRDVLVATSVLERLKSRIVETLTEYHRVQPLSPGLAREEMRARLFGRGQPAVFERALEDLAAARVVSGSDRISLASHQVELPADIERATKRIESLFLQAGLAPPDRNAVASSSDSSSAVVDQAIGLLQRQKVLVRIDTLLFHEQVLKRLKREVAGLKTEQGARATIDVATFKERFGVTRKFAIPLLEYLDRERVTRRVGDVRQIL